MKNYRSLQELIEDKLKVKIKKFPSESDVLLSLTGLLDKVDDKERLTERILNCMIYEAATYFEDFTFYLKNKEKVDGIENLIKDYYLGIGFIFGSKIEQDWCCNSYFFERKSGPKLRLDLTINLIGVFRRLYEITISTNNLEVEKSKA